MHSNFLSKTKVRETDHVRRMHRESNASILKEFAQTINRCTQYALITTKTTEVTASIVNVDVD